MMDPPLVVDLDGTLLRSDLLVETGLLYLRDQPHRFWAPLLWVMGGKAALKYRLADATDLDVTLLPYDDAVIALIDSERQSGRRIVLATASQRRLAERVAAHLGLFDEVLATDTQRNLSAGAKRDALVERYGERGYDYAGNAAEDLTVWQAARWAYVVNASGSVLRRARRQGNVHRVLGPADASMHDWLRALRLHQWLKNLLIFVPLLTAHLYGEPELVGKGLLAFLSFSLCASSVYLLNDLLDLPDDRRHASKRQRPFASGLLPIHFGLAVIPLLLLAAFAIALWQLPALFSLALAGYYILTVAYSLSLKRRMVIDVIALAALYTLRIIAGALALAVALSFWLLAFSMFMFLSLALVKRYAELYQARAEPGGKAHGRGYDADDLPMIASLGAASGYLAVMVLALYINDAVTVRLYSHPTVIWLACPLLLTWISRVWMLAHRGQMHEDPVIFAMRDRTSLGIVCITALVFWLAI